MDDLAATLAFAQIDAAFKARPQTLVLLNYTSLDSLRRCLSSQGALAALLARWAAPARLNIVVVASQRRIAMADFGLGGQLAVWAYGLFCGLGLWRSTAMLPVGQCG